MEETTDFTLPVIHLNGTGAETLGRECATVRRTVADAIGYLSEATYHPRDFYLIEGSWEKARQERTEMLKSSMKCLVTPSNGKNAPTVNTIKDNERSKLLRPRSRA